jgi:hypothetical protein
VPSRLKTIINKALNTDPSLRYSSALEMRRKLEKLHFSGYWTTDSSSNLIGIGKKYTYHFDIEAKTAATFNFVSTKKSNQSGNITKVKDFTKKNLNQKEMEKLKNEYISWVIDNAS